MNDSQWRYFALNQFLLGKSFAALPDACKAVVADSEKAWNNALSHGSKLKLSPLEQTFLSFLRVPDYGICVSTKQSVLTIDRVVELVHEHDLNVNECNHWATATIAGVNVVDIGTPGIKDGILYVPEKLLQDGVDLDGAMRRVFALRCWGTTAPTAELKSLVKTLLEIVDPSDDINMSAEEFGKILAISGTLDVNPTVFAQTVLRVSDLSAAMSVAKTVCWWSTIEHQSVSLMIPRGSGNKLAHAKIPTEEFIRMVVEKPQAVANMRAQGGKIIFEDAAV